MADDGASVLAEKFWTLGNAITAFAILQMIAFLTTFHATRDFQAEVKSAWLFVCIAIVITLFVYLVGLLLCFLAERNLRKEAGHSSLVKRYSLFAFLGRLACAVLATGFGLVVMCQNR